jgi:hypothetical protein
MCELFAAQQLSPAPEDEWRSWANNVSGINIFSRNGIPSADGFDAWQDWAQALVGIMNVEQ